MTRYEVTMFNAIHRGKDLTPDDLRSVLPEDGTEQGKYTTLEDAEAAAKQIASSTLSADAADPRWEIVIADISRTTYDEDGDIVDTQTIESIRYLDGDYYVD